MSALVTYVTSKKGSHYKLSVLIIIMLIILLTVSDSYDEIHYHSYSEPKSSG